MACNLRKVIFKTSNLRALIDWSISSLRSFCKSPSTIVSRPSILMDRMLAKTEVDFDTRFWMASFQSFMAGRDFFVMIWVTTADTIYPFQLETRFSIVSE